MFELGDKTCDLPTKTRELLQSSHYVGLAIQRWINVQTDGEPMALKQRKRYINKLLVYKQNFCVVYKVTINNRVQHHK